MDARRWDEIRAVFDEVVDAGEDERASRLAVIGTTDPALRAAVDKLLKADADADAWLAPVESPLGIAVSPHGLHAKALGLELQLRLQATLGGAYRIERELTGGGMSCVFVAEETAFQRLVVIKVLRPDLAEGISARRFQREIQLAARLQHPHIVPLLNAGEADQLLYYTMPFVDGESLRDRLRLRGELPIDDTVRILRDITGALAYAHRQGVVHRDIKPENVLLSDGGAVVTDFGIAKALRASRTRGNGDAAISRITEQGMALGTPLYMAPEQAADDPATDHRADLYALGAVAYEMLSGRPPFDGRSSQQLMAAHAVENPEPVGLRRPKTPPGLAALVMRCLEKRPADRPQNADQVIAATEPAAILRVAVHARTAGSRRPIHLVAWLVGAALAGVGAGLAIMSRPDSTRSSLPASFDLALPDSAIPRTPYDYWDASIAVSPDGSVIAYVGGPTSSLYIRPLNERLPRRLEGTEDAEPCLSFSPDGQWVAFISISRGRLSKIAIRGGPPVALADSVTSCEAWTERNEIVFSRLGGAGALYRVSADGGPVSLVARADSGQALSATHGLPGRNAVLACIAALNLPRNPQQLAVVSLESGRITRLTESGLEGCPARYANGHVIFARKRTLFAAPFSLRTLRVTGPEIPLLRDSLASFSTAANGTLAYISNAAPRSFSFVAVGEGGKTRALSGRREDDVALRGARPSGGSPMLLDTSYYAWPRLSPDGKRVAMELYGHSREVLWVYDIPSRTLSQLNTRFRGIQPAGWTADGRNVVYIQIDSGNVAGPRRVVSQPWDGSAPARELIRLPDRFAGSMHTLFDISIGPSHGHAAFVVGGWTDSADIWIAPLDDPSAARPLAVTRSWEGQPRLSPDGTLIAYTTHETGHAEVNIRSVLGPATLLQVSTGGGFQPLWSRDGSHLFYRVRSLAGSGFMMRATISRGAELSILRRDTLFRDVFKQHNVVNYDVFPGDKELLMIQPNPPPARAGVVLNWPDVLLQRYAPR